MSEEKLALREKRAWINMYNAACDYIGSLENAIEDGDPGAPDYEEQLKKHDELVGIVYLMGTSEEYGPGYSRPNPRFTNDLRFLGKAKLEELARKAVTKLGY